MYVYQQAYGEDQVEGLALEGRVKDRPAKRLVELLVGGDDLVRAGWFISMVDFIAWGGNLSRKPMLRPVV
jgi:hypothetical protein